MHTKTIHIYNREVACINCTHFYQHYVKHGSYCHPIHIGHCAYPRIKDRIVTDSCIHFSQREEEA